ncbi:MAG: ComF family protein [Xanthomonadales bacterium]|nr:ComF family protein [Xanthomonadales bacterium]
MDCQPNWRRRVDGLLNALLPQPCVVCRLDQQANGLCPACRRHLPWVPRACRRCALPLPAGPDRLCGACLSHPPVFDAALAPLRYRFPVDRLVHAFKFQRDLAAGRVLTELLVEQITASGEMPADLIVPVPMHRWRLAARGLNPAFEIARRCGQSLTVCVAAHQLQRSRHTRTQTGLDAAARRRNLRGAFRWRGQCVAGQVVALVDDVMTTGSTVSECTRVLKRAGAGRVSVWALARAI